ncbi:GSCFA domain-containing protein [Pseudomonas oryzihabitans]|uniref:GSCFA domain-containing protein n=1 Tax=Pseudomonas oryzihabitans TaxID=47885 RepID=UPI00286C5E6D|nr:GSCFA domain-containing protein [Pseudomonas psychrotolerans]
MSNPYTNLPKWNFWRNAVEGVRSAGLVENIWTPKFGIGRDDLVVTAGSCFAQHISRYLKSSGFSWVDSEPAPDSMDDEEKRTQGYGVFSFRTGNIYTPTLLEQWIDFALGKRSSEESEYFFDNGLFFDLLRPALNPGGYASLQDAVVARDKTLECMRRSLASANTFIFTLGLTEAWLHKCGTIYPVCPGTIKGDFNPDLHYFHNYDYSEILACLKRVFDKVRSINPIMRFVLTVSPVPLTATADSDHILTATTYSKAVLRAVAGFLSKSESYVDYFPSYELVSSPLFEGASFANNKRSVTDEGVTFVMRHFMDALSSSKAVGGDFVLADVVSLKQSGSEKSTSDILCEELILESWENRADRPVSGMSDILLVGDSHMGQLSMAFSELEISHSGGGIMWGSQWHNRNYLRSEGEVFLPNDLVAQGLWRKSLQVFGGSLPLASEKKLKIITNLGAHTHMLLPSFIKSLSDSGRLNAGGSQVTGKDIYNYLADVRVDLFSIVKDMVDMGHQVVWVSDPPAQISNMELYEAFDRVLCQFAEDVGARSFDARSWIAAIGGWKDDLYQSAEIDKATGEYDRIHGNANYYSMLARELLGMFS